MLTGRRACGFTLVETMVALALMLAGLAGAGIVLLQGVQYERESSNRRTAIRFAGSLAEELRALNRSDGVALAADTPAILAWVAAVEAALPVGKHGKRGSRRLRARELPDLDRMAGCGRRHAAARAAGDDVTRDSGLTLVEVLVAMLIVLIVLTGSLAFVARGRAAHRTSESLAQLEEALDAAFSVLVAEIQLAGYLGLAPPASAVAGASAVGTPERADLLVSGSCGPSLAHDLGTSLAAVDSAFEALPGLPIRCRPSPDGRHVPQTDTLLVRHAAATESRAQPGRLQLETNLRSAVLSASGSGSLGANSRWHDLEVGTYYISADSTGRADWPSLRRKRLVGGTRPAFQDEELVSGIADLQIELGVDDPDDSDTAVDRWVRPNDPLLGGAIRALKLELEARSDVPELSQPGMSRRKRVARVVELRNHGALP